MTNSDTPKNYFIDRYQAKNDLHNMKNKNEEQRHVTHTHTHLEARTAHITKTQKKRKIGK